MAEAIEIPQAGHVPLVELDPSVDVALEPTPDGHVLGLGLRSADDADRSKRNLVCSQRSPQAVHRPKDRFIFIAHTPERNLRDSTSLLASRRSPRLSALFGQSSRVPLGREEQSRSSDRPGPGPLSSASQLAVMYTVWYVLVGTSIYCTRLPSEHEQRNHARPLLHSGRSSPYSRNRKGPYHEGMPTQCLSAERTRKPWHAPIKALAHSVRTR
jgi:hypothetical protein